MQTEILKDAELLSALVDRGDGDAFGVLMNRYKPMVYRVCLRRLRGNCERHFGMYLLQPI